MRIGAFATPLLLSLLLSPPAPAESRQATPPTPAAKPAPAADSPETWTTQCDGGDAEACVRLGTALEEGTHGLRADPKAAAGRYETACKRKHAPGCVRVGNLHMRKLIPGGVGKAKRAFGKACDLNDGIGCHLRAQAETPGKKQHVVLLKKACELKVGAACFELGVAYKGGFVKGGDPAEATVWFQKACDLGHRAGCGHAR